MRKAFTLVELMVVIGIIALLIALALVALGPTRAMSRDGKRKADLETIRSGLELYRSANGTYPQNIGQLNGFISQIPTDPLASRTYFYKPSCTTVNGQTRCYNYSMCASLEIEPLPASAIDCSPTENCRAGADTSIICNYGVTN